MCNGCFDCGLTVGHIELFRYAKSLGNKVVVAINSDASVTRIKRKPILPLYERMLIVDELKSVDYVIFFEEDTPLELIKTIKPAIIVKGGDYKPEEVVGYGLAEIKIFPLIPCVSTTQKIISLR